MMHQTPKLHIDILMTAGRKWHHERNIAPWWPAAVGPDKAPPPSLAMLPLNQTGNSLSPTTTSFLMEPMIKCFMSCLLWVKNKNKKKLRKKCSGCCCCTTVMNAWGGWCLYERRKSQDEEEEQRSVGMGVGWYRGGWGGEARWEREGRVTKRTEQGLALWSHPWRLARPPS